MTCRRLTQPVEPAGTLHWLACGECRNAAEADARIRLALDCMRAEAEPDAGSTLQALGLIPAPAATPGLRHVLAALGLDAVDAFTRWRARIRRLARQTLGATAGVCALLSGWILWADRDPAYRVETPATPSPNAFTYFRDAGTALRSARLVAALAEASPAVRAANRTRYTTMVPSVRSDRSLEPYGAPNAPTDAAALLKENTEALRLLRSGFRYAYVEPPIRAVDAPAEHFRAYRDIALLLALEGQARGSAGDLSGAVDSSLDAILFGAACQNGGPKISKLVGLQCEAIGRAGLWERLDRLSARNAARAAHEVLNRAASKPDVVATLEEEAAACFAAFTRMTASHRWRWGDVPQWEGTMTTPQRLLWSIYTLRTTRSGAARRIAGATYRAIARRSDPYPRRHEEPSWSQWDPVWGMVGWPEYGHLVLRDDIDTAENGLLAASLGLRAYRLTRGSLPGSLDDLVRAGLLRAAPHDPFDPKGGRLRYAVVLGRPVIYSVGPDGKDDGGVPIINDSITTSDEAVRRAVGDKSVGDIVAGVNTCW